MTVIGVNDTPVIQAASTIEVWENTTHVTDINVRDLEWEEVTVQIADLGDGALFEYDTQKQTLSFIDAPNFEAPGDGNGDKNNLGHRKRQHRNRCRAAHQRNSL